MKIRFLKNHSIPGATRAEDVVYSEGDTVDFKGPVAETYARKYINRGIAAEAVAEQQQKPKPQAEPGDAKFNIVKIGRTTFNVVGADGKPNNDKLLTEDEAKELAEKLNAPQV